MMLARLSLLCLLPLQQVPPDGTPPPDQGDEQAWDLIRIAEAEAARARVVLTTQVANLLLSVADAAAGSREVVDAVDEIARLGPDTIPILLDVVAKTSRITSNDRSGVHAVRALVRLSQVTRSEEPLSLTLELLAKGPPMAQRAILAGLDGLRHPRLLAAVKPFLSHEDRFLRQAAIEVLSGQEGGASAELLRPMLMSHPEDVTALIPALLRLGDQESSGTVAAILQSATDQEVMAAAVSFLKPLGDAEALPALQATLQEQDDTRPVSVPVRDVALQAVRDIGLRSQGRFRDRAERILVETWQNTTSAHLRNQAQLALGPYHNAEAFDAFEERYKQDTRNNRNNANLHLDFAEKQLVFEEWNDALRTLKKADDDDDKGALATQIAELRAVAYCGLNRYDKAEKELRLLGSIRSTLPGRYPVVERMAQNPKYAELFQQ